MLTFWWKYNKLKQIEGLWNAWGIFTGLDPRLSYMCQNGVRAKETEADIAEHVSFFKGQHELKTLNVFFESTFEDLSFHSFLKVSD